ISAAGDIYQEAYPRSAMKYFQQIPLLETGAYDRFGFTSKELAVMCGSHKAEAMHIETVDGILAKIGFDRSYLQCGPQAPSDRRTAVEMIRTGIAPQDIYNNCSGKHAG